MSSVHAPIITNADIRWNGRGWAFLAGFLCGFGNGIQFMGGQAAGYAAADSVQIKVLIRKTGMYTGVAYVFFGALMNIYQQRA